MHNVPFVRVYTKTAPNSAKVSSYPISGAHCFKGGWVCWPHLNKLASLGATLVRNSAHWLTDLLTGVMCRATSVAKNYFCHNNAVSDGWGAPANNYHPKWGPESYAADASYKRGPRQHRSDLAPERQCCAANYACRETCINWMLQPPAQNSMNLSIFLSSSLDIMFFQKTAHFVWVLDPGNFINDWTC